MLKEADIIAILKSHFPQCIGDDAAVIPFTDDLSYVITKDVLVEGVHFRRTYYDATSLACKAMQVNLSDLAAMGALPKYILLGLSLPELEDQFLTEFLDSFAQQCKQANVILIGGDTTQSNTDFFISVTAIGVAQHQNIKWRHHALNGDVLAVAGNLGNAHLGWQLLEQNISGYEQFKQACLRPEARLGEGQWCAQQIDIHACMDLSDGLLMDSEKMAVASHLAANLEVLSDAPDAVFIQACEALQLKPHVVKIIGGEDYGLLLSIHSAAYVKLATEFEKIFGYRLKKVGYMTEGSGLHLLPDTLLHPQELQPFTHFGETHAT